MLDSNLVPQSRILFGRSSTFPSFPFSSQSKVEIIMFMTELITIMVADIINIKDLYSEGVFTHKFIFYFS